MGVVMICGLLALEMSGSTRRTVSTSDVGEGSFIAVLHGGVACQPGVGLPTDAGYARVLVGSYYRPLPAIRLVYRDLRGAVLARGYLPAGARQGQVEIPLSTRRSSALGALCLHFSGTERVALAGSPTAQNRGSLRVDGRALPAQLGLILLGQHPESWWQTLGTLSRRFDWGKSTWIGVLTFPLMVLVTAMAMAMAVRQLWRLRT